MDSGPSFCPEYFPAGSAFIVHLNSSSTTYFAHEVLLLSPMQYYFFFPPFLFARIE